jgi:transketolase N-terminal domain/subunit
MLVCWLSSSIICAQQKLSNWSNVENLKHGAKIVVVTKNGREFVGTKRQTTDDTLFLETTFPVQGVSTVSLTKSEISSVAKSKSRKWIPVVGTAIGIAIGLAFGARADRYNYEDPGLGKALLGSLGGGIGFATGATLARRPKQVLVYLAP